MSDDFVIPGPSLPIACSKCGGLFEVGSETFRGHVPNSPVCKERQRAIPKHKSSGMVTARRPIRDEEDREKRSAAVRAQLGREGYGR